VLVGAHVHSGKDPVVAIEEGMLMDADVVQIFVENPRGWKTWDRQGDCLVAYRSAQRNAERIKATFCHVAYLVNLASPDKDLRKRSVDRLAKEMEDAVLISSSGLVLHPGSHRGSGLQVGLGHIKEGLQEAFSQVLSRTGSVCPVLLENTAGGGDTIGRSLEELAELLAVLELPTPQWGNSRAALQPVLDSSLVRGSTPESPAAGHQDRPELTGTAGICLDTQHLFASGRSYDTAGEVEAIVSELEERFGPQGVGCVHMNDSKVPLGSGRDRHENIGEGFIGSKALGLLLGHPFFAEVPIVLEVPGAGKGPRREDLEKARLVLEKGQHHWQ
jgi:deoxyribonuclease-4